MLEVSNTFLIYLIMYTTLLVFLLAVIISVLFTMAHIAMHDIPHLSEKYFYKNFTKSDLANIRIFNSSEVCDYMFHRYRLSYVKMQDLIRIGTNIINNNQNLTLRVPNTFMMNHGIIHIKDIEDDCEHEIKYGNEITMKVMCNKKTCRKRLFDCKRIMYKNGKTYKFSDFNDIELYFLLEQQNRHIVGADIPEDYFI